MSTTEPTTQIENPAASAQTPPPPPPVAPKRLTRPRDDRMISGVSGGIARYLNVDATIVRLGMVVVGLVAFPFSIVGYLVAWAIMPLE